MATKTITVTRLQAGLDVRLVSWAALGNGDDGAVLELVDYADMTFSVDGTFGAGGSITLKGSNDGTNYYPLTDPGGTAITRTAAGTKSVTETPRFIKPFVTAGDGTTALVPYLLCRRGSR
jgi:hypothetical protein